MATHKERSKSMKSIITTMGRLVPRLHIEAALGKGGSGNKKGLIGNWLNDLGAQ